MCGVRETVFPQIPSRNELLIVHFTNLVEARLQSNSLVAISIAMRFDYYFILSLLCSLIDKHKNFISQSSLLLMEKMDEGNSASAYKSKEKVHYDEEKVWIFQVSSGFVQIPVSRRLWTWQEIMSERVMYLTWTFKISRYFYRSEEVGVENWSGTLNFNLKFLKFSFIWIKCSI